MLGSFVEWLDSYLAGEEPSAVVRAAIGIMSFAVLIGAIFGSSAVKLGALAVALLFSLSVLLVLLRGNRRMRGQLQQYRRIVMRYGDEIMEQRKPAMGLKTLNHVAVIDRNGDVEETIRMRVVALKKELQFIPHRSGPGWAQPASQLRRVKVQVRGLSVDGKQGTKWFLTEDRHDGKLNFLAHLHTPVPMGTEVDLEINRTWPGKCAPLMRHGETEVFTYDYTRPIDYLRYVVILPAGVEVYCDSIGFAEGTKGFSLSTTTNTQGSTEVTLIATDVPVDRKIGMRLELK